MDSGFQHSGFRVPKRAGFHFFTGFNAFLRTSFSCSNLAILKEVVRRHNKFVFFFDLQNYQPPTQTFLGVRHAFRDEPLRTSAWEVTKLREEMYHSSVRVYGIIMRGTLGDCLHCLNFILHSIMKEKNTNLSFMFVTCLPPR